MQLGIHAVAMRVWAVPQRSNLRGRVTGPEVVLARRNACGPEDVAAMHWQNHKVDREFGGNPKTDWTSIDGDLKQIDGNQCQNFFFLTM